MICLISGRYFQKSKVLLPLVALILVCSTAALAQTVQNGATVVREFKHDTGPILREIAPLLPEFGPPSEHEIENNVNPNHKWNNQVLSDPVLQTPENTPSGQTPSASLTFDGEGDTDTFFCNCMPPDNDGAVGTTQFVQFINGEYQVFDKSGNSVLGPLAGNTFWSGFGGSCEADNSGDPVVRFDAAAQRWVVSQFAINNSAPDYECIAVSQTADATGAYNRYAFSFNNFPDYPKMGVWPDAYYFTFNMFNAAGTAYVGADVCADDRTKMLTGAVATMQCLQQTSAHFGMLPSDLDGATPPANGTPNFVMELDPDGSAHLSMFKFHVDFTTPANSTFTGPTLISVAAFTPLCNSQVRGQCVQQPTPSSDLLESLGDRLMWRLAYRNFGDHTALLATHSIVAASSGGVRWYEIRSPETSPTVFQSGTFAPDSQYRWMPAIAMDQNQDIAVGYSVSGTGAGQYPSIAYAGRIPTDAAGTLEPETVMTAGLGSQVSSFKRWGDYSSLTVDPVDDCTFWFTEEYLKATGGFNWSTRIGKFIFAGCGTQGPPAITSLSVNHGPVGTAVTISGTNFGSNRGASTVTFNGTAATTYSSWNGTSIATQVPSGATTGNLVVTVAGTASNTVPFTVSVTPTVAWTQPSAIVYGTDLSGILNASAVYQSNPVAGTFAYTATKQGGSPVAVTSATVLAAGTYTLTANFTPTDNVTYTSATGTVSLAVNKAAPNVALGTSVNPIFKSNSITFTATVSSSVSTPTGTIHFFDGSTSLGSAVTLSSGVATLSTSSLSAASHSITAQYSGDSNFNALTSSAVSETVQDFTLSVVGSSSQTAPKGGTATYNLQIAPTNGTTFPAAVNLALSGAPNGSVVTVTPQSVAGGDSTTSITVTVQVPTSAPVQRMAMLAFQMSPFLVGLLLPFRRIRQTGSTKSRAIRLALLSLITIAILGIAGCGGSNSQPAPPQGPPTFKMALTGTANTLSHSTTLTLTVQ